jgi:antitoxin MazE
MMIPVVRVGNSRGIRFPKKILEAIGSPVELQLDVQDGVIMLRPVVVVRQGWDDAARWQNATLDADDVAWLDAPLTVDDAA